MTTQPQQIPEENVRVMKIFSANSKDLHDAVLKHVPKKTTIKYKVDEPTEVIGEIDDATEAGLVSKARLFMGDNVANFNRVVNILLSYHKDEREKVERLREYKKAWKKSFGLHSLFRLGSEEDNLTNEKVFETLAYGKHLHSEKFDEHLKLQDSWLYPMVKIQLQSLILNIQALSTVLNAEFVRPFLEAQEVKS